MSLRNLVQIVLVVVLLCSPFAARSQWGLFQNNQPVPPPTFPVTSGLNLYTVASNLALTDGANITTWADLSGAGNDLTTQSTNFPTFALTGSHGVNPYVTGSTNTATPWMLNAGYSINKQAASFFGVFTPTVSHSTFIYPLGAPDFYFQYDNDANAVKFFNALTTTFTMSTGRPIAFLITLGTGAINIYWDSSTNVQSAGALTAGTLTGGFNLFYDGVAPFYGMIYEVAAWNRELTSGEAASLLDTYAPSVYGTGLSASAPTGYAVFDGDSLTQGIGATKSRNWPYYLNPGTGWNATNKAVSGQTWTGRITNQAQVNNFAAAGNWLFIWCGANDINNGDSAATIEANFITYMNAAVAAGFVKSKIVVFTTQIQNLGSGGTARDDYNTWLRANYTTYAGWLVDPILDPNIGVTGTTPNNASYWFDGVHYNDSGYVALAALVRSTVTGLPF